MAGAPGSLQRAARRPSQSERTARAGGRERRGVGAAGRGRAGRRPRRVPLPADRVPAAGHAVRRHEGSVRAGPPGAGGRAGHQRGRRRAAAAIGGDAGARGAIRGRRARPEGRPRGDAIDVRDALPGHFHHQARARAPHGPDAERDPGSVHLPPSRDASADRRSLGGGGQADRDPAALDSWKYVGFEDHFRGAREDIRRRLAEYVPAIRRGTAMCSTSGADAASSSISCARLAFRRAASIRTTRWSKCAARGG